MWVVFLSTFIPLLVMGGGLFIFVENIKSAIPDTESEAWLSIPIFSDYFFVSLCLFLPPVLAAVWCYAYYISCRLVGPLERIERELKERVEQNSSKPIHLRKGDILSGFVEQINNLLTRK